MQELLNRENFECEPIGLLNRERQEDSFTEQEIPSFPCEEDLVEDLRASIFELPSFDLGEIEPEIKLDPVASVKSTKKSDLKKVAPGLCERFFKFLERN